MSVEEDIEVPETELKDLVTQTLEENGLLSKIRAQLRAGLYVALENEINESNKHCHINNALKTSLANAEVRTAFCLVIEFLEYFNLDFTKTVFEKESFMGILYDYKGKETLINELNIELSKITKKPLIIELLSIAQNIYKNNTKIIENEGNIASFINDSKEINNTTYDIQNNEIKYQFDELDSPKHEYSILKYNKDTSISSLDSESSIKETKKYSNKEINNAQNINIVQNSLKTEDNLPKFDTDDTYEGTSSLADDSVASYNKESPLIDLDKSIKIQSSTNSPVATVKSLIDQSINELSINKQDVGKKITSKISLTGTIKSVFTSVDDSSLSKTSISEIKRYDNLTKKQSSVNNTPNTQSLDETSINKSPRLISDSLEKKKHDKIEKPKPMSGLSSLADLPPLQVTKTRSPDTVLLPSLYSKEFREKSNLKEIDKLLDLNFDSIDNYEEDDILSSSIDYDKHKNVNSILSKNDLKVESSKSFCGVKLFDNDNKNIKKITEKCEIDNEKQSRSDVNSNSSLSDNKKDADNTSISEDLDFNSNSDESLKSDKTKF